MSDIDKSDIYEKLLEAKKILDENTAPMEGRWIICTNRFLYEAKVIGWWRYQWNRIVDYVWHLFYSKDDM